MALIFGVWLLVDPAADALAQAMPAAASPPAGATKICAPFVPNVWRTVTPVPGSWAIDDCRGMGTAVGASMAQIGCLFQTEPSGQPGKFSFGATAPIRNAPTPALLPNPNCGW
jgi:hypothetical protein